MRYLIISDIHGSCKYLKMVLEEVKVYDKLIILGDILYHGPRNDLPDEYAPREVIDILNGLKNKIIAVRGNCDAKVDLSLLEFEISDYNWLEVNTNRVFLTHGDDYNESNLIDSDSRYTMIHGHSHINKVSSFNNVKVINVGSLSLPKDGHYTYALLQNNVIEIHDIVKKEKLYEEIL